MAHWTFLSNHAHVLHVLAESPDLRMREIAERVQITERAVQRIIHDLVESGYLEVTKDGRRNHYAINHEKPLRHQLEAHTTVHSLLELFHDAKGA